MMMLATARAAFAVAAILGATFAAAFIVPPHAKVGVDIPPPSPCPYPATCATISPGSYLMPGVTQTWNFGPIDLITEAASIQAAKFWLVAIGVDRFDDQCIRSGIDQASIDVELSIMQTACYPNCTRPIYRSNPRFSVNGKSWASWAIMARNPEPGQPLTVALTNLNGAHDGTNCAISLGGVNGELGVIEYQQEP